MRALLFRNLGALAFAALALAGCAKYPKNGASNQFTRLTFRYTLAAPVSPDANYIYVVAIRPLFASDPFDDGFGPVPVYAVTGDSNPKNGFVEGRPTRYVVYAPGQSLTQYLIKGFEARTPTPSDDNPVDLAAIVDKGEPIQGLDPQTSGDPNTLGFDLYTSDLVDDSAQAQQIVAIQFNIIATNKALRVRGDASGRVVDALGDQSFSGVREKGYYRAIITTSGNFPLSSNDPEPTGDTYGGTLPSVDISRWTMQVSRP